LRRFVARQIAVLTTLPVALIVALIWLFLLPQVRTNSSIQQHALARTVAGEILAHLMGGERQLVALADVVAAQGGFTPTQLTTLLDAGCGEGELFEAIYIVEAAQNTISHIGLARPSRFRRADLVGIDVSGRDLIRTVREELTTAWSETFLSTVSSHLAVAVAVPLPGRVIIGEITLNRLSDIISQLPVEAGLTILVIDRQGRIVADSLQQRSGQQLDPSALPAGGDDPSAISVSGPIDLGGEQMTASMVAVERLGWRVLVAQPHSAAFQPVRAMLLLIAAGLVIALVVALALAWFSAKRFADFVKIYTLHAKSIANGDYDLPWPVARTIEYHELGENLQAMARQIRHRERQLAAGETHMRITLDSIGDGVITTDTAGVVTRLNPVAANLTGWPAEEAIGQPLSKVFHIVDTATRRPVENPVDRALTSGKIVDLGNHTLLISRNGREYQIADSGAPIRYPDGQIAGVVLVFRDVTERYRQAQEIRESQRRLQELTANVPGVVYQFESTRDHQYSLSYVSEKARDIFKLDLESESFFEAFSAGLPIDEGKAFMASIEDAVNALAPWHYEGRFIRPDGETIWFSGNADPRKEGDTIVFCGVLLDITARKQVEESLRITQFSFDNAAVGIYRIAADARILEVNAEAARMLGYTREEMATLSIWDVDPNVNPDNFDLIWQSLVTQGIDHFETRHRRKDGSEMMVEVHSNLLEYDGEQFAISFARDITERKHLEASLRITQFSFDNAPVGMYRIGPDARILQVNTAAARMLGYSRKELTGLTTFDIDPHIDPESLDEIWESLTKEGALQFDRIHRRKDGREVPVEVSSKLLDYEGQQFSIAFVQDITERKQAETELRRLRNYLANIIDSMPSVLVGVDHDGRVTLWNRQAEAATGLSFKRARHQPLENAYPRLGDAADRIRTAIAEHRVLREIKVPSSHRNEDRYEDITIFPLVTNGIEGAVIRVDDVTERVRLEELMIQSEKMLSVGGLAAGMAHEINNPLAGILQNAAVLNNRLLGDLPANREAADTAGISMDGLQHYLKLRKLPEMVANISSSGQRASTIVKNMLGFARKSDRTISSHDACQLMDQTIALVEADYDLKKKYDFKKIRIIREYEAADMQVSCDAGKIQQVFLNLLKNGAEAMAGGGATKGPQASGKTPQFIIRAKVDGDWVQVEVEDNGPGMDAKTRRSVFEPFFTTKPVGEGTGLGLSVSYFIVTEDHGGEMAVEAAESGGARFVIRLPKAGREGVKDH
jgi:PAS domain S-box-containing protein